MTKDRVVDIVDLVAKKPDYRPEKGNEKGNTFDRDLRRKEGVD